MSNAKTMSLQSAKRPGVSATQRDFLIGKDRACFENPGNHFLKGLVKAYFAEYQCADAKSDYIDVGRKRSKIVIVREIVDKVKQNGGRFLRRCVDGDNSSAWFEVSAKEETNVVIGAFRNQKRNNKKRNKAAGPIVPKSRLKDAPVSAHAGRMPALGVESTGSPFLTKDARGGRGVHGATGVSRTRTQDSIGGGASTISPWDVEPIDNFGEQDDDKLGDIIMEESAAFTGGPFLLLDWFADRHGEDGTSWSNERAHVDEDTTAMMQRSEKTEEDCKPPAKREAFAENDCLEDREQLGLLETASIASNNIESAETLPSSGRSLLELPIAGPPAQRSSISVPGCGARQTEKIEKPAHLENQEQSDRFPTGFKAAIAPETANPRAASEDAEEMEIAQAMLDLLKK